jgi:hypothetical protein
MRDRTKEGFIDKRSPHYEEAVKATNSDLFMGLMVTFFCIAMVGGGVMTEGYMGWIWMFIGITYGSMGFKFLQRYLQKKRTCYGLQPDL